MVFGRILTICQQVGIPNGLMLNSIKFIVGAGSLCRRKITNSNHQMTNKSQISIIIDQNIHHSCIASFRKINYTFMKPLSITVEGFYGWDRWRMGHWDLWDI